MVNCESCQIAVPGEPLRFEDRLYCCAGCAAGGPCVCTYEHDLGRYPPAHYARPVSLGELLDRYEREIQTEVI